MNASDDDMRADVQSMMHFCSFLQPDSRAIMTGMEVPFVGKTDLITAANRDRVKQLHLASKFADFSAGIYKSRNRNLRKDRFLSIVREKGIYSI